MSEDVKNIAAGDTGNSANGAITVKGNRNNHQQQNPPLGEQLFAITGFDTSPPGAILKDRLDDPTYYAL